MLNSGNEIMCGGEGLGCSEYEHALEYFHNCRDVADNASSTPPPGEVVRLPCVWVYEAYPPGFIDNIYEGIEALGWESRFESYDFIDFIGRARAGTCGGAFLNLGYVTRESDAVGVAGDLCAEIPIGVTGIHIWVFQPVPSLTLVCYVFFLGDDFTCALEDDLRGDYKTYVEVKRGAVRFVDAINQKKKSVLLTREYVKSVCTGWVAENFPGYFSSDDCIQRHPTCEIVLLKEGEPFSSGSIDSDYLEMLELKTSHFAWKNDEMEGLFFKIPFGFDEEPRVVIAGNVDKILSDEKLKFYGGRTKESKLMVWCQQLCETFSVWALYVFSSDLILSIGRIRDMYGNISIADVKSSAHEYHVLNNKLLELQKCAVHFSADLCLFCNDDTSFKRNMYVFTRVDSRFPCENFPMNLRHSFLRISSQVEDGIRQISIISTQFGSLISTISSNNLSKTNMFIQKTMLFFTAVASVLAFVGIFDKFDAIVLFLKRVGFVF